MNPIYIGLGIQAAMMLLAYAKWDKDQQKDRIEHAERFTRMETKVDTLYHFWEVTMERRGLKDQMAYVAKQRVAEEMHHAQESHIQEF